jgi:hypothetical protein
MLLFMRILATDFSCEGENLMPLEPEQEETDEIVKELGIASTFCTLGGQYVIHPEEVQERVTEDWLFRGFYSSANQRASVVVFTAKTVFITIASNRFGRFNAQTMVKEAQLAPKQSIKNFEIRRDAVTLKLGVYFEYKLEGKILSYYGFFSNIGNNKRNLKFLASIGFYGLVQPFKVNKFDDIRCRQISSN